jgi:hypothetical protein
MTTAQILLCVAVLILGMIGLRPDKESDEAES